MKLLPESPVEFLESISKPSETVFISEITGSLGKVVVAGITKGILRVSINKEPSGFASEIENEWGVKTKIGAASFEGFTESMKAYLDEASEPVRAVIQPVGLTDFIIEVHRILSRIPVGETLTYSEIAEMTGRPKAARAVGNACGRNRALIAVPCHRALAKNGLGGFGGGLELKKRILAHEGVVTYKGGSCKSNL